MGNKIWPKEELATARYSKRNNKREDTLIEATMSFIGYFMGKGDDQAAAEQKVTDFSTEAAGCMYVYTLGNSIPLKNAINTSALSHMDQPAKDALITYLNITP